MSNFKKLSQPPSDDPDAQEAIATGLTLAGSWAAGDLLGPLAAGINIFFKPAWARRLEGWYKELHGVIGELQARGLTREELNGDVFFDAVMAANRVAAATASADKRTALRNALMNTVLPGAPSEAERFLFFQHVETFTEWELRILKLVDDPQGWKKARSHTWSQQGGTPWHIAGLITDAFPDLAKHTPLVGAVWSRLTSAQLVTTVPTLEQRVDMHEVTTQGRATQLGRDFLRFIAEPSPTKESGHGD